MSGAPDVMRVCVTGAAGQIACVLPANFTYKNVLFYAFSMQKSMFGSVLSRKNGRK
jgi:nitroimidazol reductase NimA-like FMN-containing flavoprotein (pyridoxamine 5'-phosphate oxidase superfamily)